ncbi:MAG: hypothetical protein JRJ39_16320 [Deltaproteobacteria bacterium]|nr:hypothetical protein [Deltaproteobacteria bacterium]
MAQITIDMDKEYLAAINIFIEDEMCASVTEYIENAVGLMLFHTKVCTNCGSPVVDNLKFIGKEITGKETFTCQKCKKVSTLHQLEPLMEIDHSSIEDLAELEQ